MRRASPAPRWSERCRYAAARARGRAELDPGIARAGIELFRLLPATAGRQVLLCTDLHPGNVLAAARESWLVIDPKPHAGDPAYDPLQHMLNFPGRLAGDPGGFADRMAGLLGLDAGRLRWWLFARCVQESASVPRLRRGDPARALTPAALSAAAAGTRHQRAVARQRSTASTGANTTHPTWSSRCSSQFGTASTSHPA